VVSANSTDRRDHVLSGPAGRLQRDDIGLVTRPASIPGAEVLPGIPRTWMMARASVIGNDSSTTCLAAYNLAAH
jgi:hypothetical protein